MQYLLIAVTIASAAAALAMCAVVFRMIREERRRADARVEALVAMADSSGDAPLHRLREDLPGPSTHVAGVEGLFASPEVSSPRWRRFGAAALGATALVAVLLVIGWVNRGGSVESDAAGSPSAAAAPLELLSLTHATGRAELTVTGLVQNPTGGAALSGITAVALAFAPDGAFVASGRAPLDFVRLDPGSESPFVVKVPTSRRVARYRVSFRGPDGAVIAHVDRRSASRDEASTRGGPVARNQ